MESASLLHGSKLNKVADKGVYGAGGKSGLFCAETYKKNKCYVQMACSKQCHSAFRKHNQVICYGREPIL